MIGRPRDYAALPPNGSMSLISMPRAGRKRYTGLLQGVTATGIGLEVDKQKVEVPFEEIAKARLAG